MSRRWRHSLGDVAVAHLAVLTCLSAWAHAWVPAIALAAVGAVTFVVGWRMPIGAVLCVALVAVAAWRSESAWHDVAPRALGPYTGWAEVVGDPAPFDNGLRVTVEIGGERFDAWAYGSPRRRLVDRQSGDLVWVAGTRRPSTGHVRRAQLRHVVGRFDITYTGDVAVAAPLDRASTRVRTALRSSADSTMPPEEAALFTGLVIGDDAREPPAMIQGFRDAGLSHLTAVSGQNLAFVIAAAGPLLRRLRPSARWAASVGLIGWFMAITRFEPSVLRAGLMAILAISAFSLGRRQHPARLLAVALTVLVLVDPFLVWSVGLWLSVGATAGVCVVGPWITARLRGPRWWCIALGTALGAQVGVAVPSLLVFHRLPVVSVPANLLAVPVAGAVMLVGLPVGLAAAWAPIALRSVLMAPCLLGTRWVATVADIAARLEPRGGWVLVGWAVVLAATAATMRPGRATLDDQPPTNGQPAVQRRSRTAG